MDYSREEQSEDSASYMKFFCEKCEAVIGNELNRELVTEFEYALLHTLHADDRLQYACRRRFSLARMTSRNLEKRLLTCVIK